jgi:hypothetical protein
MKEQNSISKKSIKSKEKSKLIDNSKISSKPPVLNKIKTGNDL